MENTIPFQTEQTLELDSLLLASLLSQNPHRTIHNVQMIVAALLRYAATGVSVTNSLIGWTMLVSSEES